MDTVPTQTAGVSELLASDWNTYVKDNFDSIKYGHVVVSNEAGRPSGTLEGTMIYQSDVNKFFVRFGGAWVEVLDLDREGALPETSPGHLVVADDTAKAALTPSEGMMVYQSDNNKVFVYSGSAWVEVADIDGPPVPSAVGLVTAFGTTVNFSNVSSFSLFGLSALRTTFVKQHTASAVLATMSSNFWLTSGNKQGFKLGMYNPTSGSAHVASAMCQVAVTEQMISGSSVIWSGLAAGSYTVEPAFGAYSAANQVSFYNGGGGSAVDSSFMSYSLVEVRV